MSEIPEEKMSTHPTTATGTAQMTIRPTDSQEEIKDIKETVGDITVNSLNTSTRCHASSVRSLGGDTLSDSQTHDSIYRGTVGDTTVTPISQME